MTMTNAEWMIKQGYKFKNIDIRQRPRDFCIYGIYIGNVLIDTYRCTNEMTYIEVVLKWLDQEHVEPILDEAEKRYLENVIRPFRDKIKCIRKYESNSSEEFIYITFTDSTDMDFPNFTRGTMYKGMEVGRKYTLEELGL